MRGTAIQVPSGARKFRTPTTSHSSHVAALSLSTRCCVHRSNENHRRDGLAFSLLLPRLHVDRVPLIVRRRRLRDGRGPLHPNRHVEQALRDLVGPGKPTRRCTPCSGRQRPRAGDRFRECFHATAGTRSHFETCTDPPLFGSELFQDRTNVISVFRSRQRVADHGEVFTPAWMVEAMLDLVRARPSASMPAS